jgi:hypothetical protein
MIKMIIILIGLLFATPVAAEECHMVVSPVLSSFLHELAHCNGWSHPLFESGWNPPYKYIHPYAGKLYVTISYGDPAFIKAHAQKDAVIDHTMINVPELCMGLWDRYNVHYDERIFGIVGCSLRIQ